MSAQALPVAESGEVRRAAWRLIRSDYAAFIVVLLTNCAAAGAGLVAPWLIGQIVNEVQAGAEVATIDRWGLLVVLAAAAQLLIGHQARRLGYRFGERTAARLREQLADRLMRIPARAVEGAGAGDLTSRATTDAALVSFALRDAAPEMVFALAQALIIIVAVVLLSPVLGLVGLVALVAIPVVLRWYLRRARSAYLAQAAAQAEVADVLAGTAAGARTVEALGLQERRAADCSAAIAAATAAQLRTLRLRSVFFPTIDASTALAVGAAFGVGGLLYLDHQLSLGTVVAVVLYLRQLTTPIDTILVWVETLQSSAASFARIEGLASSAEPARRSAEDVTVVPTNQDIVVTDVRYAYDGADVLHGVDLDVRAGEHLAVVGTSGAGKTTLGRLIAGIDRPRSGRVTVGGADVADLGPEQLRQHVVLVTQEHHVFADPLRDNLTIAAPHATDDELLEALDVLGADWFEDLPDGLDTDLGTHRLGGAQAQHVALARVLLANPHTLVLDEATALLDPRTARRTEEALAATIQGRTIIAVAHRLQTARDADRIAVMEEGCITELGHHDDLVATATSYASLWAAWSADTSQNRTDDHE
ncbi:MULTISPECIES: ABC transporter ATP-binding protein [unclassified Nocardioides]|uniref:ABC transporter ATP-binding protein n=1 Tax=unclassified Nocardioides TaxID=2615069 RepID=UPI000701D4B3|nr:MULTISPECIES: ABC transporter ATP-binding protein [unclassified Nocardioides]KQY62531.1 multidrug ABC transporter ATP-binding protein [Nocardioides sp. Root140]KQZ70521.1 multidrug ABC transporter ATP-binding protein [Nocardioides sp. Root151]